MQFHIRNMGGRGFGLQQQCIFLVALLCVYSRNYVCDVICDVQTEHVCRDVLYAFKYLTVYICNIIYTNVHR